MAASCVNRDNSQRVWFSRSFSNNWYFLQMCARQLVFSMGHSSPPGVPALGFSFLLGEFLVLLPLHWCCVAYTQRMVERLVGVC